MKAILKRTVFLFICVLICVKLSAQTKDSVYTGRDYVKPFSGDNAFRTWSFGLNTGVLSFYNILEKTSNQPFLSQNSKVGYGAYIRKQILPSFGIQTDFFAGSLSGTNSQPVVNGVSQFSKFNTKIQYAVSVSGVVNIANINWHYNNFGVQPYVSGGLGDMDYVPATTLRSTGVTSDFKTTNDGVINELYVPLGVGLKFNVSRGVNVEIGYQLNFVYTDNLYGNKYGPANDKFSYGHIGLEFALGNHSKPQLSTHNPVSSLRYEYLLESKNAKMKMQAVIDSQKIKNDQLQRHLDDYNEKIEKLTLDSDSDGVSDYFDKCPNTPPGTKVDGAGCPLITPLVNQEVKFGATPEATVQIVKEAVKNLQFDVGKATIREQSFLSLEKLARLLIDRKLSLKLAGYSDSQGSAKVNLALSRDRAVAVKTYLVKNGVNPSNIIAVGYGKAHPIASNKTAEGRQLNRRVEFTLY